MDPKTRLNYCLNEFNLRQPTHLRLQRTFQVLEEWGPSHEKMFVSGCFLNGQLIASARGQSLADSQMGAARRACEELYLDDGLEVIPLQTAPDVEQARGSATAVSRVQDEEMTEADAVARRELEEHEEMADAVQFSILDTRDELAAAKTAT